MNSFSTAFNYFLILVVVVFWFIIITKALKNKCAHIEAVQAVVVDKYTEQTASKIQGVFKHKRYQIVFLADKKKLAFEVSEFSYQNYRIGEKGTLKYKGNKIIEFN